MTEEIIIKTETVYPSELKGREKQIYDYAYNKGVEVERAYRKEKPLALTVALAFVFAVGFLCGACIHTTF